MIPLWLTPGIIKGGILGIIIMAIFFTGWHVKGGLDSNRITKLKVALKVSEANYDLSMENLDRAIGNYDELYAIVQETNAEVIKQGKEYNLRVIQLKEINRAAINRLNTAHDEAMSDMITEANELREVMQTLSVSEACHWAMLEIVK